MVRPSSHQGSFALSYTNDKRQVVHHVIHVTESGYYLQTNGPSDVRPSLKDLLLSLRYLKNVNPEYAAHAVARPAPPPAVAAAPAPAKVLEELFPAVPLDRIASVLASVDGDVPMATAMLLSALEAEQRAAPAPAPAAHRKPGAANAAPAAPQAAQRLQELLWRVFALLSDRDLCAVPLVCKAWHRAAARPELWAARIRARFAQAADEREEPSKHAYVERPRQRKADLQVLTLNRIRREYLNWYRDQSLHNAPLVPLGDDPFAARITLPGPANSYYAGGTFSLDVRLPRDYPLHPPTITFQTKIIHPNVDLKGVLSLAVLESWTPLENLRTVMFALLAVMRSVTLELKYATNSVARDALELSVASFEQLARAGVAKYARP